MKRINIMTSCDDGIAEYILPQIASIGVNLSNYDVQFFLFHSRISSNKVKLINEYSKTFSNISFNEIVIENTETYEKILQGCSEWPYEAFFSLCCHEHLPIDVERILYIDAADVIIDGNIDEYYFADFEGCSLIATAMKYTNDSGNWRTFNKEDMTDINCLKEIRGGVFNSGAYVINVANFRRDKLSIDDFIYVSNVLQNYFNTNDNERVVYTGDQGILSVAFLGDIKFFAYPEAITPYYMPYNFCIYFFDKEDDLWYTPKILHYAGFTIKPWKARFSAEVVDKFKFETDFIGNQAPFHLKGKHIEFFEIWWKYCEMTPIYDELNKTATIYARTLETYYLPLCKQYNDLLDSTKKGQSL